MVREALTRLIYHPLWRDVGFDREHRRFLYRSPVDGSTQRAYGLTLMLRRCFWPDYDAMDPRLVAQVRAAARRAAARRKRKQKKLQQKQRRRQNSNGGGGGGKKIAITPRVGDPWRKTRRRLHRQSRPVVAAGGGTGIEKLPTWALSASPQQRGLVRGHLVHEQLGNYAMDQFYGTRHFRKVEAHPYTLLALSTLKSMRIRLAIGELIVLNPQVPMATPIDLVGWHDPTGDLVLIEIKTGSPHRAHMGTGPMHTWAGWPQDRGGLGLSNSPWSQGLVQLACAYGTVQQYGGAAWRNKLRGLLLWVDGVHGTRTQWLRDAGMADSTQTRGLLGELQRHQREHQRGPKTNQRRRRRRRGRGTGWKRR